MHRLRRSTHEWSKTFSRQIRSMQQGDMPFARLFLFPCRGAGRVGGCKTSSIHCFFPQSRGLCASVTQGPASSDTLPTGKASPLLYLFRRHSLLVRLPRNVVGAIDGSHIKISPPDSDRVAYHNYKKFYSSLSSLSSTTRGCSVVLPRSTGCVRR